MDSQSCLSLFQLLRAIPVPNKTATTAAHALFQEVLLLFGFPAVLQSDRRVEFLNAVLYRLTAVRSIKQVFTFWPKGQLNLLAKYVSSL